MVLPLDSPIGLLTRRGERAVAGFLMAIGLFLLPLRRFGLVWFMGPFGLWRCDAFADLEVLAELLAGDDIDIDIVI